MLDFLKSSIGIILALAIGFGAAELMSGNTSFLTKIGDTLLSWRASLGYAILGKKTPVDAAPKEGSPTPGTSMTPGEITEAQRHFNKLAGIDVEKREKEKAEEKKKEEEKQAEDDKAEAAKKKDEEKIKIPKSLFPVKKKRKSLAGEASMETGAVYALGTSPYGPPPFVKSKIFTRNTLLHIDNDPNAAVHAMRDPNDPYKKPDHPLPLMKMRVENVTLPALDPENAFTIQLGAFEKEKSANKLKQKLSAKGYDVGVYKADKKGQRWYYVRLNEIMTEEESSARKEDLMKDGNLFPLVVPIDSETKDLH